MDEVNNTEATDVSMAIRVDDLRLLECVFHAEAPIADRIPETRLLITNPDVNFTFDVKTRRTVCRSMVCVQFGLFAPDEESGSAEDGKLELVHYGITCGMVATVPVLGAAAPGARHMAGAAQDSTARRDKKMEHSLRLESIKAAYAYASSKLLEMTSMSPLGPINLPLIDADELLLDIERREAVKVPEV